MKKHSNSIGNDIVALEANNARTCQPRFYSKFLAATETALFKKNNVLLSQENFIWLCWSIKESVYKFHQRLQPQEVFAAGKINIHDINMPLHPQDLLVVNDLLEGEVIRAENCFTSHAVIGAIPFYSYSLIAANFIYTITANKQHSNKLYWGVKKIDEADPASQSFHVRQFASQKLTKVLNAGAPEFIKSTTGIPQIQQHPQIPISFSHHDKYVAYAFLA